MNSRGFSLLSVMVMLGASGLLFAGIYEFFKLESVYSKYAASEGLLEDLRAYVNSNLDCDATFPPLTALPPVCGTTAGGEVVVQPKTSPGPLIQIPSGNNFTRYGPFALRGWCKTDSGAAQFSVQVNRLSPDGSKAIGDPVKNLLMDGSTPPLYPSNSVGWKTLPGSITCSI